MRFTILGISLIIAFGGALLLMALPMADSHGDGCLVASLFGKATCWGALFDTAARHIGAYLTLSNVPVASLFAAFLAFALFLFVLLLSHARGRPSLLVVGPRARQTAPFLPYREFHCWYSLLERSPSLELIS